MATDHKRRDGLLAEIEELRARLEAAEQALGIASEDSSNKDIRSAQDQRLREMLQLVIDNIPQHIFWKDRNSVYLGCNMNFAKDAGFDDPSGVVGKTDYDLAWKREEADAFIEYDRRVMEADSPILHIIEPQLQADGKEAWLDTNKIPLHDAEGNVVGMLGTFEDITERRLMEVERENARKALEAVYERERRIAETLQRSFLPDKMPALEGYLLAQAYRPALSEAAIGGDVYDVFKLPCGKIGMTIADVSGKGLRAARYGAMVKYMLRAHSYRTLDPAEILALLNSSVSVDLDIDSFITCFFGILDPDTGRFDYANAGHEEPLLISANSKTPMRLKPTGPALGLQESAGYGSGRIVLVEGDILLLYTDGVTDARGAMEPMHVDGLEEHLLSSCGLPAEEMVECLLDEVMRRSGDRLADDVAMVALQVTKQPRAI